MDLYAIIIERAVMNNAGYGQNFKQHTACIEITAFDELHADFRVPIDQGNPFHAVLRTLLHTNTQLGTKHCILGTSHKTFCFGEALSQSFSHHNLALVKFTPIFPATINLKN
ncbi:hypothetical protein QTP70_005684 [Hemibagrus guttatus]|uniref:Uncharacterized protein n=1 Tax=Hemibagrus guttatus TaxID=175788 RepID=A0AAE0USL6_9TELE|nr:hypothetical protein QTP70_005684 [Hemibagrus guttatus]